MKTSLRTWIYATRPHTLGASFAPMLVVLGALISDSCFSFFPYLCALIVALAAQVTSNFSNDYFDYKDARDAEGRVGFRRVLTTGEVTPQQMRHAMILSTATTTVAGIVAMILTGAWWLLAVGLLVLLCVYAYSYGPYPLSTHGLADFAVVLFYGVVPILATYAAIGGTLSTSLVLLSFGMGIWEDNIMVCNNYRDYAEDRANGKQTIIVRMGESFGPVMYYINCALTLVLLSVGVWLATGSVWATVVMVVVSLIGMIPLSLRISKWRGSALNQLLKLTNIMSVVLGVTLLVLLLV